jgi:hypothetical protein
VRRWAKEAVEENQWDQSGPARQHPRLQNAAVEGQSASTMHAMPSSQVYIGIPPSGSS